VSNVAKIAVPLLLLAALAGGGFYLMQSTNQAPPVTPVVPPAAPAPQDPTPEAPVQPMQGSAPKVELPREPSTGRTTSRADAPQGVRGRVLRPDGAPAADVPVYLMENLLNDMTQIFLINRGAGRMTPPVAAGQTGPDGTFELGILKVGKALDLRVVPPENPEFQRQQIKVLEGDWYDTGDILLDVGLVVQGRVVEAHSKAPVPNATVYLASSQQAHTMIAAPGRERGTPAVTDAGGGFRFATAPRLGPVNLIAEAPGYANAQLLNQMLKQDGVSEFTLELDLGQPISGVVVDVEGRPIANAKVDANGLSTKTPQMASTVSQADGTFVFETLRVGPYQVVASAPTHAETRAPLVLTGESGLKLVMQTRGTVKLSVLSSTNQPVKAYRLSLKKHYPQAPGNIGNVLDWPDRSINPSDYREWNGEWASIKGLPGGDYRFQITDQAHAKTLSPPFTIVEGGAPVEVVAKLTLGGIITGTVIDDRGQPVAGATVTTDMNGGLAADTGILEIFRAMIPEKHTKESARTNEQGKFRLTKLAFADYMLRVAHPDYCEGTAIDIKLEEEGREYDAGVIQLALGAVVEGVTMVGGQPTGQVKVTLSTPFTPDAGLPTAGNKGGAQPATQATRPIMFNASVQSDGTGRFRLLKRVPPGTYKATATRPTSGGDPFGPLMDMKESEQQIVVQPGQQSVSLTFQLGRR
jgi:hypothetical protein